MGARGERRLGVEACAPGGHEHERDVQLFHGGIHHYNVTGCPQVAKSPSCANVLLEYVIGPTGLQQVRPCRGRAGRCFHWSRWACRDVCKMQDTCIEYVSSVVATLH